MEDISIFDNIALTLLTAVLLKFGSELWVFQQLIAFGHLSINKSLHKI